MNALENELREHIARAGPLSFRDVMQAALYHPEHGYYTLGRQALDVWEALDGPRPFRILELGAGSGALAEPLLAFLRGQSVDVVYTIDEVSPKLREVQRRRLTAPAFRWEGAAEGAHFIIANEVADALPVHRVVMRQGRLRELHVGLDGQDQSLVWWEASGARPELEAYFEALHYVLPDGHLADVCLDLVDWVKQLAGRLERGVALVMDYSASPPRDSLLTYYRHAMGSDPLRRLGEQDISAHVDLRTLVRLAIAEGLRAGATAQRGLLLNLGFEQLLARLPGPTDRQALGHLADPNGLGGQIAAVFLLRGLPGYTPAGAVGGRVWPEPSDVPSLTPDQAERDFLDQWREAFSA
ncbi:MAG: SAM-dependent methyltransferase [Chloroflexi bacterium]|nr:SAM-dependent methyltransferase [Chloroflexota bacterium]